MTDIRHNAWNERNLAQIENTHCYIHESELPRPAPSRISRMTSSSVIIPHRKASVQTCSCLRTWYASSSCRRSSPHLMMTDLRRQLSRCPYGDDSRILRTFSAQGSFRAAADGSSGSRWKQIKYTHYDCFI